MGEEAWNPRLPFLYAIYHLIRGNFEKAIYLLDIQIKGKPNRYLIKEIFHYLKELERIIKKIPNLDIFISYLNDYLEERV